MLQEVEILPTWVYFHPKGCLAGLFFMMRLPCFDPILSAFCLGVFNWETDRIWTRVLHRSCSCIYKLDVRLLNHPNQTSTTQVMVHFPRLPQLRLFICCVQILGLVFELIYELSSELSCGLCMAGFVN